MTAAHGKLSTKIRGLAGRSTTRFKRQNLLLAIADRNDYLEQQVKELRRDLKKYRSVCGWVFCKKHKKIHTETAECDRKHWQFLWTKIVPRGTKL